jgi:hypothetical protein
MVVKIIYLNNTYKHANFEENAHDVTKQLPICRGTLGTALKGLWDISAALKGTAPVRKTHSADYLPGNV